MQVIIPMAGEGSRFSEKGYKFPKPLVDINGKSMIQRVVDNLPFKAHFIFLVRKSHLAQFTGFSNTLKIISNGNCSIIEVDNLTEGAACTVLLAKNLINSDEDILIANSDQIIDYEPENFLTLRSLAKSLDFIDGIIFTFKATHPKWSFVKIQDRFITEVAEKNPISDIATCGIYWFKTGADFVKYATRMINSNSRVNNEFYIAPVYNELIKDNKKLIPFYVNKMYGVGTPEDLEAFLSAKTDLLRS
jgi:NDP-sugar pyrophosphorylase family protein